MAKKIPPHLPPPVSNLVHHHLWQRVKFLLFIVVISLLVGMCGAAIIFGWVWPRIGEAGIWFTSYERPMSLKKQLMEDKVKQDISLRLAVVYRAINKTNNINYFKQTDKLGEAMVVGSDGWLAMYKPDFVNISPLYVLISDNKIYKVEKTIFDKYSGMVYLKITGGQFKVVSFNEEIKINDDLFVYQNDTWNYLAVQGQLTQALVLPHLDSAPSVMYVLDKAFAKGEILVNKQGRVVGVIKDKNILLPITSLTNILPTILSEKVVKYPSLGVMGWFDKEQPIIIKDRIKTGFVVDSVWWNGSQLLVGDVITQINGRDVDGGASLWYNITNNQKVKIKIWRNDKEMELETAVTEKKL